MKSKYEAVIGLEVHAQLLTDSKAFCGCSTKFGNPPNTNICPVCLGYPGTLPVLNEKVVEFTILMGLATNCKINKKSIFARKNYFYPDLPKGYQISQYELPICEEGFIDVTNKDGKIKKIGIHRIHMEEDAGKSIHDQAFETLVDVNRCGVPLIEIVSNPDMRNAEEARMYLIKIRQIVKYLGICDGNMEEGSLRCDANISVRLMGEAQLGTKTEVKNMNSFKNVERAINHEIERQIEILEDGGKIQQQTMLWNADLNEIIPMRSKEEAHDYRYFPDPDLLPVNVSNARIDKILRNMPELPEKRKEKLINNYMLPEYDADLLTQEKELVDFYESVISYTDDYKSASNWIMGDVLKIINEEKIDIKNFPITAENLAKLINLIKEGTISGKIAKDVFQIMLNEKKEPAQIIKEKNLVQISNSSELQKIVEKIINENEKEVQQYINGKDKVLGFLVGQTMRQTGGKANPQLVNQILKRELDKIKGLS
jgi:aspartyl-tRNA(Asn)/glutamyl-tRNA(Gln) amidotransferase subunit B